MKTFAIALAAGSLLLGAPAVRAEPPAPVRLVLKDHRFAPDRITVPAGQPVRIELLNQDAATEEFDSEDLHVERDVTPHGRTVFTVGPLKPGTYGFMGELHADTASGVIVAEERK